MINLSKCQSNFAMSQGFYFQETSHLRSYAKIKPSQKFPNLLCHFFKLCSKPLKAPRKNASENVIC